MSSVVELPESRAVSARTFLNYLTANTYNFYHLWRLDTKTTFWHRIQTIDSAVRIVSVAAGDVYVGVGLSGRMWSGNERLREDTAVGRMALVADLDVKPEGFTDKESALAFAHSIPIAPSVLVDSGGGIQCWWVFDQPWNFEDDEDKARAASFAAGWHEFMSRKASKHSAKLDSVFDITRIMRVPGGRNHKFDPPRIVRALHYGSKIDREVFADFAVESAALPVSVAKLATTTLTGGLDDLKEFCQGQTRATNWIPDLTVADYQLFETALPKWKGTFNMTRRDPRMRDKSKSEFCFSLAGQAAWLNVFPYSKILTALVYFYRKHGIGDKQDRLDWFIATLRKAAATNPGNEAQILEVAKETEIEEAVVGEIEKVGVATSDKTSAIARVLGVPISRFIKWGIEPVTFGVIIERRQIELGTSKDVFSQMHWRQILYESGYMMKGQPKPAWDTILRELTKLWELQPLGAVADKQLNLKHLVADMVLNQGATVTTPADRVRASRRGLPFMLHSENITTWWVPARVIRRLIEERDGRIPTNEQMARNMLKIGYKYARKNSTADGSMKTGYYYGTPLPSAEHDPRAGADPYEGSEDDDA